MHGDGQRIASHSLLEQYFANFTRIMRGTVSSDLWSQQKFVLCVISGLCRRDHGELLHSPLLEVSIALGWYLTATGTPADGSWLPGNKGHPRWQKKANQSQQPATKTHVFWGTRTSPVSYPTQIVFAGILLEIFMRMPARLYQSTKHFQGKVVSDG